MISVRLYADDEQDASDIVRLVTKAGGEGRYGPDGDRFVVVLRWPESAE